jgi:hypothetical protein
MSSCSMISAARLRSAVLPSPCRCAPPDTGPSDFCMREAICTLPLLLSSLRRPRVSRCHVTILAVAQPNTGGSRSKPHALLPPLHARGGSHLSVRLPLLLSAVHESESETAAALRERYTPTRSLKVRLSTPAGLAQAVFKSLEQTDPDLLPFTLRIHGKSLQPLCPPLNDRASPAAFCGPHPATSPSLHTPLPHCTLQTRHAPSSPCGASAS